MQDIYTLIAEIASDSINLKNKYLKTFNAVIDYAVIFAHTKDEHDYYISEALELGEIIREKDGTLFKLNDPVKLTEGVLNYMMVKEVGESISQKGYADFVVNDYEEFKKLARKENKHFKEFKVDVGEMYELSDDEFSVKVYIPSVPLTKELELQNSNFKAQSPKEDVAYDIENQISELKNKNLQLMADFQNYKKRMDSERATFGAIANIGIIQEILEIHDDLELAFQDQNLDLGAAKSSIKTAQEKLLGATKNAGIERVDVKIGDEFDKEKMEAISAVADEKNKNKVIAVISSAYKYVGQDGILKPAKVIVGK